MHITDWRVFVKPWPHLSLVEMARLVRRLGFEWIELPVRPGYWCEPAQIEGCLPAIVHQLAEEGVWVGNITTQGVSLHDERVFAACAEAGITLNRIMFPTQGRAYWEAEQDARMQLEAALPLCEEYGLRIGVQNHNGNYVGVNAMGLYHLLKDYDPQHIAAVWDPAHNALEGEEPELALDIIDAHMCMLVLKNAYWQRMSGPEAEVAEWRVYWTAGHLGRASWPRVAQKLKSLDYQGPICMAAEYTDEAAVERLVAADVVWAQSLF